MLSPVYAIRDTATGDISLKSGETSNAGVAWSIPRGGSYMSTPLLYRDVLYVCGWNGVLQAFNPTTGERFYQERLGAGTSAFTSSLVAGDGKIYFTTEEGDVHIVTAGKTFALAGTQALGDSAFATPAISEGVIYFRTAKNIIAIGK
jgi:outer membrane protein assembly factor BamB